MNKIEIEKYTYNFNEEIFNVYIFPNDDMLDFYIERKDYANLYHCVGVLLKDKPNDMKQFIENNLDDWIFIVMNETEED